MLAVALAWSLGAAEAAPAQLVPRCGGVLGNPCPVPPQCGDGQDNDRDAVTDLADPGCVTRDDLHESDDPAPDINGVPGPGPDVDPRAADKLFGFNTGLSEWNWAPPAAGSGVTVAQEGALIRSVGGNAQRFAVQWFAVQPRAGEFRDEELAWQDGMYAELTRHGMTPIITIHEAPTWATEYANCRLLDLACHAHAGRQERRVPPANVAAYASFVRRIADRYDAAAIETWNEPNNRHAWNVDSWPDPARMAAMQCAAYDAVKQVNPDQRVLAPGLGYVPPFGASAEQRSYLDFARELYRRMGGRVCWDVLSVHVYPGSNVAGTNSSTALAFRVIRNLKEQYGDETPIWITETGSSTTGTRAGDHGHTRRTPEEQLQILRAAANELLATPDVGAVIVHTLRDRASYESTDPTYVGYGFGLLAVGPGPTPPPKPAWCHFTSTVGGSYPGCVP